MFYTPNVDIASTKSMWNFLHDHYKYYTMNSLNRTKSIANNVKLYNLNLDGDWTVALRYLQDEADSGCLQMFIDDEIQEFERQNPCYEVGFNGRQAGYIVLRAKGSNASVLPDCVDKYDDYEEFKADCRYYNERVSDYNSELRDAVEIVREFDRLCDRLRDIVNDFSKMNFDESKLYAAVERFNCEYEYDLDDLGLMGPVVEEGKVKLHDICAYNAFMHCFLECFGEDRRRAFTDGEYLYLREN